MYESEGRYETDYEEMTDRKTKEIDRLQDRLVPKFTSLPARVYLLLGGGGRPSGFEAVLAALSTVLQWRVSPGSTGPALSQMPAVLDVSLAFSAKG